MHVYCVDILLFNYCLLFISTRQLKTYLFRCLNFVYDVVYFSFRIIIIKKLVIHINQYYVPYQSTDAIRTPDTYDLILQCFSFKVKMKMFHRFSIVLGDFTLVTIAKYRRTLSSFTVYDVVNNFYIDQSILSFTVVGIQPLYRENTDFKGHTGAIHGIISAIQHQWSFSNLLLLSAWWLCV